jgi:hypothetical protein
VTICKVTMLAYRNAPRLEYRKGPLSMRFFRSPNVLITALAVVLAVSPAAAGTEAAEPTREECTAAVDQARALATALPAEDLSRYFAERHLQQAQTEAGSGEFDECVEYAERARVEVTERRHRLQPGETFKVLRPDEWVGEGGVVTRPPGAAPAGTPK